MNEMVIIISLNIVKNHQLSFQKFLQSLRECMHKWSLNSFELTWRYKIRRAQKWRSMHMKPIVVILSGGILIIICLSLQYHIGGVVIPSPVSHDVIEFNLFMLTWFLWFFIFIHSFASGVFQTNPPINVEEDEGIALLVKVQLFYCWFPDVLFFYCLAPTSVH